jgi:hypothetical protein
MYFVYYFPRTHLNITRLFKTNDIGTGIYALFDFLYMRSDKISGNYRPPNVPKYILPNTNITCIFEKLFFLFKGTGSYKNRLIQFPYKGLISQDFALIRIYPL